MDNYLKLFSEELDEAFNPETLFPAEQLKTKQFDSVMKRAGAARKYTNIIQNKLPQLSSPVGWTNRFALAIIYVWFGFFKIINQSAAQGLVGDLQRAMFVRYIPANIFLIILGIAECFIGILWLFPKLTKFTFIIFLLHIVTTFLPLFFLPTYTWNGSFTLSLEGQYIVKNVVLIASAVSILFDYKKTQRKTNMAFRNNDHEFLSIKHQS